MQRTTIELPDIRLVGLTCRTSTAREMDPATAQIGAKVQEYFAEGWPGKIANRKRPGITYCVYTEYESDFTAAYTYFIGEEVADFTDVPQGMKTLAIPSQKCVRFTAGPGPMPQVCINAWQEIWQMTEAELGGRAYIADFELYDERAHDSQNTVLDIYVGIK